MSNGKNLLIFVCMILPKSMIFVSLSSELTILPLIKEVSLLRSDSIKFILLSEKAEDGGTNIIEISIRVINDFFVFLFTLNHISLSFVYLFGSNIIWCLLREPIECKTVEILR